MGAIKDVLDAAKGKKPGKGKQFLTGLKDWAISPGGIATLILFAFTMWYIHHSKEKKGAKA
jgi:hypothetical protein